MTVKQAAEWVLKHDPEVLASEFVSLKIDGFTLQLTAKHSEELYSYHVEGLSTAGGPPILPP